MCYVERMEYGQWLTQHPEIWEDLARWYWVDLQTLGVEERRLQEWDTCDAAWQQQTQQDVQLGLFDLPVLSKMGPMDPQQTKQYTDALLGVALLQAPSFVRQQWPYDFPLAPIEDLHENEKAVLRPLATRTLNCLQRRAILNIGEVVHSPKDDLATVLHRPRRASRSVD